MTSTPSQTSTPATTSLPHSPKLPKTPEMSAHTNSPALEYSPKLTPSSAACPDPAELSDNSEERHYQIKQCCLCESITVVDKWVGYCRVCLHSICRECIDAEYLVCCACSRETETHALSAADYCKYCGHLSCEKCHDPNIIRASDSECSMGGGEEEDAAEHYEEYEGENGDSEGDQPVADGDSHGEEPNILCDLARFTDKMKCCGCGHELEAKPVVCETCGHEECQECHYLDEIKD